MPSGTFWQNTSDVYQDIAVINSDNRTIDRSGTATTADTPVFGMQVTVSGAGIDGNLNADDQAIFEDLISSNAGSTIVIDRAVSITSDLTIPATVSLHFARDGKLCVTNGHKIVFGSTGSYGVTFNDALHQIFDFDGDVKIEGIINLPHWRAEWFNAAPYSSATDSIAFWREMFEHYKDTLTAFYPKTLKLTSGKVYYWEPFDVETNYLFNDMVICSDTPGSRFGSTIVKSRSGLRCLATKYAQGDIFCDAWSASTAYSVYTVENNSRVRSRINTTIWKCTTAGTTGGTEPVWPASGTVGSTTVTDGSVVWTLMSYYNDINTRIAIRDIQFQGYGTNGASQSEYILDTSGFDLLVMQNVSIFYSKWGWVHDKTYHEGEDTYTYETAANGGAVVVDNFYCVANPSSQVGITDETNGCAMRLAANIRMTNVIIENSYCQIYGSYFEGTSMLNTHLESSSIDVYEGIFTFGLDGGQTSAIITLHPQTHDCVVRGMAGNYTCMDMGYNNTVTNGHRGVWANSFMSLPSSSIVDCSFPGPVATYLRCVLPKGRKYLASIPVTRDQETTEGISTITHEIWDVATGTAYKEYEDIPSISTQYFSILHSRFEHIWDVYNTEDQNLWVGQREVDTTTPLNNADGTRYRFAHILNYAPDMKYSYVSGKNITETGAPPDTSVGWYSNSAGSVTLSNVDGKIGFSGTTNFNYAQRLQLDIEKEYVFVARVRPISGGNCLVFAVNGTTSSPGSSTWVQAGRLIKSGYLANTGARLCVMKFKPASHGGTTISFGTSGTGTFNCVIDFIALAELGTGQRMVSDGKPNCGVFAAGKTIYELDPAANSAYAYYAAPTTSGGYGVRWLGAAGIEGAWAVDTELTAGDVWSYTGSPASLILIKQTHTITAWAATTAFLSGELIVSSNKVWEVTTAGTSGGSFAPSSSNLGDTYVDGSITWTCRGPYVDDSSSYARYLYSLALASGYAQSGATYLKTIVGS